MYDRNSLLERLYINQEEGSLQQTRALRGEFLVFKENKKGPRNEGWEQYKQTSLAWVADNRDAVMAQNRKKNIPPNTRSTLGLSSSPNFSHPTFHRAFARTLDVFVTPSAKNLHTSCSISATRGTLSNTIPANPATISIYRCFVSVNCSSMDEAVYLFLLSTPLSAFLAIHLITLTEKKNKTQNSRIAESSRYPHLTRPRGGCPADASRSRARDSAS